MKCGDCKFWKAATAHPDSADGWGDCHRHAPRSAMEGPLVIASIQRALGSLAIYADDPRGSWDVDAISDRFTAWPAVHNDDFCGEFVVAAGKGPSFV
jgi:hypothetical protein